MIVGDLTYDFPILGPVLKVNHNSCCNHTRVPRKSIYLCRKRRKGTSGIRHTHPTGHFMPSLKVSSVNDDGNNVKHQTENVSLLGYEALEIEDIDCAGDVKSDDYIRILTYR